MPALTALILLLAGATPAGAAVQRSSGTFPFSFSVTNATDAPTITSTIDGRSQLPTRVRWIAKPSVPEAQVKEVDFLIDGTLRGVELKAPYNYGSDDLHGHLGWLVTSFLTPGQHKFTAEAKLKDGRIATNTVLATVAQAPAPPRSLAGHWKRRVTDREIGREQPDAVGDFPSGTWKLVLDRTGVWDLDPKTSGIAEHAVFSGHRLYIDAGLWITPANMGHTTTSRYGHTDLGSGFCREDGPPATYAWSVKQSRLTLRAIKDPCGVRRAVYIGSWTRTR